MPRFSIKSLMIATAVVALWLSSTNARAEKSQGEVSGERAIKAIADFWKDPDKNAPRAAEELIQLLKSEDVDDGDFVQAVKYLSIIAKHSPTLAAEAVPILLERLPENCSRSKCEMIRTLGAIGERASPAIPILRTLVQGKERKDSLDEYCAIHAAAALARIAPAESEELVTDALVTRLNESEDWVRWTAADALEVAGTKSERIRAALRNSLDDEHVSVRVMAASALLRLGYAPDDKLVDVLAGAIRGKPREAFITPHSVSESFSTEHTSRIRGIKSIVYFDPVPAKLKSALLSSIRSEVSMEFLFVVHVIKRTGLDDPETVNALEQAFRQEAELYRRNEIKALLSEIKAKSKP